MSSSSTSMKYQKLDPISHIHKRPDMYIGSLKPRDQLREWIARDGKIVDEQHVKYSDGLLRIFIEALSNAIDNAWRSRQKGVRATKIRVTVDRESGETSIWNDGLHIPVELHEQEKIYNPELIFGHLLSGSNLDDTEERLSSGRNGLGIKLLNVFSKEFHVEIADPTNHKLYCQSWTQNMREVEKPKIKSYKNKTGYTQIRWIPDFSKFEMEGYDDITLALYEKYCMDASMITRLQVTFNDEAFHFKNFTDYVRLYLPDSVASEDKKTEIVSFSSEGKEEESDYKTQIVFAASPTQEYKEIGFINGIYTRDGGVHLDNAATELWKQVLPKFNKGKTNITVKDLRPYFMVFVNAWAPNPEFNSQSKTKLLAPSISVKMETRCLNTILKWDFVEKINEYIRSKELLSLKKTEKKQRGYKKIDGLDHANLAGSKHSKDCTLILCEGLSAKTYAIKGINVGWNGRKGRDYYGVYALRGKLLNVRNATIQSISNNREITDIIQALGVRYDLDYRDPANLETLQYGRVMILTDADEDGHHICALIINLFHKLFPSLLHNPEFLWLMMTPVAKIFYGTNKFNCFYNDHDYQKALENPESKKLKIKYYKGLGTSSDAEIRETFGQKVVGLLQDDQSNTVIDKVFNKTLSQDRKDWLGDFNPEAYQVPGDTYPISEYINQELIKFSMEDCCRSIPNLYDGLKKSQRKILYSVFKRRLHYEGKSMKVAQLAGYCAETSNYHHGEQCLYDTITKMSQDFVGSNNIPYFEKDGQFGSRSFAGKDAANARYIFTKCAALTRKLFPEEDDALLSYTFDDGDKVEPDFYLPILPTILGNGCTAGIGTGWSCSVPCFSFVELAAKVKEWLADPSSVEGLDLLPSYNRFKGTMEKLAANKYQSTGILEEVAPSGKKKTKSYQITELPVGVWTNRYKEELESMLESKKLRSLKNYSTPDTVHFIFEPVDDFTPNLDTMKLRSQISSTNMVLFTETTKLRRFETIQEIFETFCRKRLELYGTRRENMMAQLRIQILVDKNKKRFIGEVESEQIKIFRIPESTILTSLVDKKYDPDPRLPVKKPIIESGQIRLSDEDAVAPLAEINENDSRRAKEYAYLMGIPMKDLSAEKMAELDKKILGLEKRLEEIKKTTPNEMWRREIDDFLEAYQKIYK